MQLIVDGNFVEDPWTDRSGEDALTPPLTVEDFARDENLDVIVSLSQAESLDIASRDDERRGRLGVQIDSDSDLTLEALLPHLALIVVTFPSCGDGRGFSLARQLRHRGFRGELRASGPIIADQYAFALACGFDTVEIPTAMAARQPAAQWQHALHEIGRAYQTGYRSAACVLEARRAALGTCQAGGLGSHSAALGPQRAVHGQAPSESNWGAHR